MVVKGWLVVRPAKIGFQGRKHDKDQFSNSNHNISARLHLYYIAPAARIVF